jgi:hypothetical protein
MRAGQIVQVFEQQDVCYKFESKAILQEKTYENSTVQMWIVKMLRTGKEVQRVFYNDRLKHYLT